MGGEFSGGAAVPTDINGGQALDFGAVEGDIGDEGAQEALALG